MANANALFIKRPVNSEWRSLALICCLIAGIRFTSVWIMGIMPQDAYYDFYAQHLDLSYYDHPPMIAYLLRLFTTVFGKKVFALKLADTTVTLLTVLGFFHLAKKIPELIPRMGGHGFVLFCIYAEYSFADFHSGCAPDALLDTDSAFFV